MSQTDQVTLSLILQAHDQASAAIRQVGQELARLGAGTNVSGVTGELDRMSRALSQLAGHAMQAQQATEGVGRAAQHARSHLESFANFGRQLIAWNLGYQAVGNVTDAIGRMASGLVTVNSALEQHQQTFSAIYGDPQAGKDAVAWLDRFAELVPATREEVIQAGMTIASLGDNIGEVLPPLSNMASVMGVDLPKAAQAFSDAQQGRFESLQVTLRTSKEELVKYGLQLDANNRVLNNSFVGAFERLGNERFGQGAALQMQTFSGKVSNVADAFTRLQEIAGKGIFNVLKAQLDGLIKAMGSTDAQRWAAGIGDALGHATQGAISFVGWMKDHFGPPIMAALNVVTVAWQKMAPVVEGAVRLIEGVLAGIGTFLQGSVLPVVQNATGQMLQWWRDHAQAVGKVWDDLPRAVERFWGWLATSAKNAMKELQGAWTIAWGVVSGVVGVAIDVMTGHWKKAKDDIINIWKSIQVGVLQIVNGLVDQVVHVFALLAGPIAKALNAVFVPSFRGVVGLAVEMFTAMALKIEDIFGGMVDSVVGKVLAIPGKIGKVSEKLGEQIAKVLGLPPPTKAKPGPAGAAAPSRDDQIWAQAQAAGEAASQFAGSILPPGGPIPTVTFDEKRATAGIDKYFADMQKAIDPTGKLGKGATEAGRKWWDAFGEALRKEGITLPALGPAGPVPNPPAGTGAASSGTGAAGADASKAAQDAYGAAKSVFDLLLAKNVPGGYPVGMKDIAAIATTGHKAGQSDVQVQLEVLQDTHQLIAKLLENAEKAFTFDAGVAHPDLKRLHGDELAALRVLAHAPGVTPADMAALKQSYEGRISQVLSATLGRDQQVLGDMETLKFGHTALAKQVDRIMADYAQQGVKPGSLHYRALRAQLMDQIDQSSTAKDGKGVVIPPPSYYVSAAGRAPGYGSTTVSFGPQANEGAIIAALRQQITHLQEQLRLAQALLASSKVVGVNTANSAAFAKQLVDYLHQQRGPVSGGPTAPHAEASLRARTGFSSMRRV